jgi:hypothetical protein
MTLAIWFNDLLLRGEVKDYAELARLSHGLTGCSRTKCQALHDRVRQRRFAHAA